MSRPSASESSTPVRALLAALQGACSRPVVYRALQRVAEPTTSRFRALLRRHVHALPHQRLLDLACGIGNYRADLSGEYYGADINPDYIATAKRRQSGTFEVMDCRALTYPDRFFDHVVSIAATHHLDDLELQAMVRGAQRVCRDGGVLHIVDAILPQTGNRAFKRLWFGLDAGRFPRTLDHLRSVLAGQGTIAVEEMLPGPLHDCVYLGVRAR
jgi:SAM-dependent methyltransferase